MPLYLLLPRVTALLFLYHYVPSVQFISTLVLGRFGFCLWTLPHLLCYATFPYRLLSLVLLAAWPQSLSYEGLRDWVLVCYICLLTSTFITYCYLLYIRAATLPPSCSLLPAGCPSVHLVAWTGGLCSRYLLGCHPLSCLPCVPSCYTTYHTCRPGTACLPLRDRSTHALPDSVGCTVLQTLFRRTRLPPTRTPGGPYFALP